MKTIFKTTFLAIALCLFSHTPISRAQSLQDREDLILSCVITYESVESFNRNEHHRFPARKFTAVIRAKGPSRDNPGWTINNEAMNEIWEQISYRTFDLRQNKRTSNLGTQGYAGVTDTQIVGSYERRSDDLSWSTRELKISRVTGDFLEERRSYDPKDKSSELTTLKGTCEPAKRKF